MSPEQQANAKGYRTAWSALVQMVRDGKSWSGRERNVAFLNRGDGLFADVSSVSGLDHDGDGRGMAVVDWDRDGDLDLWFRDRTAPRLRLMMNRHDQADSQGSSLALRLQGRECNRDAIGAVVEVELEGGGPRLVRSVRAGDLFLSQSSRWLHFADPKEYIIKGVRVLWPGGTKETFAGVIWGERYVLEQGKGEIVRSSVPAVALPQAKKPWLPLGQGATRVVLPAPIPVLPLNFQSGGQPFLLEHRGKPRLVMVWSGSCEHCQRELAALQTQLPGLAAQGVEVIALSLDGPNDRGEAQALMNKLGNGVTVGFLSENALVRLDEFQRALFDQTVPLAVPLAFFVDRSSNVASLYRGGFDWKELIADVGRLNGLTSEQQHLLAPPMAGTWFTRPVDPVFAAEFVARQFEARVPEDALVYLKEASQRASGSRKQALHSELADKHYHFARKYRKSQIPPRAVYHFESALEADPRAEIYLDFGTMAASYGELQQAQALLTKALEMNPNLVPAQKALALVKKYIAEGN